MNTPPFVYPFGSGEYLGCFYTLAIIHNAAKTFVYMLCRLMFLFIYKIIIRGIKELINILNERKSQKVLWNIFRICHVWKSSDNYKEGNCWKLYFVEHGKELQKDTCYH